MGVGIYVYMAQKPLIRRHGCALRCTFNSTLYYGLFKSVASPSMARHATTNVRQTYDQGWSPFYLHRFMLLPEVE